MYDHRIGSKEDVSELVSIAIKSYVETSLRIANEQLKRAITQQEKEKLSAIICGLQIAFDNLTKDYN